MRQNIFFLLLLGALSAAFFSPSLAARERNSWPEDCRVGMFLHFLPHGESVDRMQKEFQVEQLADQIVQAGADYFVLTMYQNSGWFNAPSPVYDEVTGYKAGERCSDRDIVMEMADAMARRGIKFFVYLTAQVPNRDERAQAAFGLETGPRDQKLSFEFARKWAEVFRDWSLRYGTKVSGWWVDGCYAWCGFDDEIAAIYRDALLAGNPDAVVAFNPGVLKPEWNVSDFTAGEITEPFEEKIAGSKNDRGQKKHILTYLGNFWSDGKVRFPTDEWLAWAIPAVDAGLALTLDLGLVTGDGTLGPGEFLPEGIKQIRAITDAVRGYTAEDEFRRTIEYDWLRQEIAAGRTFESPDALAALCARTEALLEKLRDEEYIAPEAADALADAVVAARGEDPNALAPEEVKARYLALRWRARDVIFENPLVKGIPIVFLKENRYIWQLIHEYLSYYYSFTNMDEGELMLLKDPGRSFDAVPISSNFPRGSFSTPSISFDGKTLYFAFADFSAVVPEGAPHRSLYEMMERGHDDEIDAYLRREEGKFHLFKMNLATGGAEQITFGPNDDFDPVEIPGGDLVFVSTRRGGFARCTDPFEPVETATLHRLAKDGSVKTLSWHETNEWNPSVLSDGRILYTRWDYVDRPAPRFMNLWVTNPDGTGAKALFGNYTENVIASLQAKEIPGSNKILFLGSGHHLASGGLLAILDPSKMKYDPETSEDTLDCVEVLTPELGFPETRVQNADRYLLHVSEHYYYSPYPLSEDFYLTAYSHDPNGGQLTHNRWDPGSCGESYSAGKLGLYYRDRFGNLELIYADPRVSCRYPIQVKARPVPPIAASQLPKEAPAEGTFVLSDVYDSLAPMPKDRPIKELRVFQIFSHAPEYPADTPRLGVPYSANGRAFLGTVPVEEDGSAHFKVPANTPLYFQAVDAEGKAVRTMLSEVYLQPGENRGCVGCHEQILTASENVPAQRKAFQRPPSRLSPGPAGTAPMSFPVFVQPILDRACVSCHDGREDGVKPDLRGIVETEPFSNAYNGLAEYVRWYEWGNKSIARVASFPGGAGADQSPLTAILDDGNHGGKISLSDADRRALYLWMDANVPFYGTAQKETRAAELRGEAQKIPSL